MNGLGPFVCEFDSGGADSFVLDRDKARNAGLNPTDTGTSAGVGPAVINDERLPASTLDLGPIKIPNQTVLMFAMGGQGCIFGAGILRNFVLQIDYLTATLLLYEPQNYIAPPDAVNVPFALSAGSPVVDATISFGSGERVNAKLLVDTAVRRFLVLSKGFTDREQVVRRVREEPIALLLRTASGASRVEPDGYLGNEFFHRFLLTLDYSHRRLLLEPNRHYYDAPAPYDGSGLGIEEKKGRRVVTAIVPKSAAAQAGIEIGDELLSLDGQQVIELKSGQLQEKLCRFNGKCVVQVRRGRQVLTYPLKLRPVL